MSTLPEQDKACRLALATRAAFERTHESKWRKHRQSAVHQTADWLLNKGTNSYAASTRVLILRVMTFSKVECVQALKELALPRASHSGEIALAGSHRLRIALRQRQFFSGTLISQKSTLVE